MFRSNPAAVYQGYLPDIKAFRTPDIIVTPCFALYSSVFIKTILNVPIWVSLVGLRGADAKHFNVKSRHSKLIKLRRGHQRSPLGYGPLSRLADWEGATLQDSLVSNLLRGPPSPPTVFCHCKATCLPPLLSLRKTRMWRADALEILSSDDFRPDKCKYVVGDDVSWTKDSGELPTLKSWRLATLPKCLFLRP